MGGALTGDLEAALRAAVGGDVRFDAYTRHLYSTDASLYAIEPLGVVSPRDADDVVAVVETAARFGVPVLPRGGGTSLAGQTVGAAVVLDFSHHMHAIVAIDAEARVARVQPGVVQDDLNRAVAPHGLFFAPDTSTANRATLGGMVGNNSCGMRSAHYGMTIDHVSALDVVWSDATRGTCAPVSSEEVARRARGDTLEGRLYRDLPALVARHDAAIRRDIPAFWRRSGGYRLERLLPERGEFNLANAIVGSEGTLALVTEAVVQLVPQPRAVVAVAGHFVSVSAAIEANEDARACGAAAIELVDQFILDLARRSPIHGGLVAMLHGTPGAVLFVEFHGDTAAECRSAAERLEALWRAHGHGYATLRAETAAERKRFQELRKAGNGMLQAAGQGRERSLAFVEDTAVDPMHLAEYTSRFAALLARHGLRAGFYGHASAGCLHIRPFMDLTRPGSVATLRAVAEEVLGLVQEFGGMNSSEHGDGLVRSEFNERFFGRDVYGAMREVKGLFDPLNRLNPGKKVDAPRMTEHLRDAALARPVALPTHFPWVGTEGMHGAADRCARIGECRKSAGAGGTMCPSYMATRDEQHSTRGRANALVHALSSADPAAALGSDRLHEVLDLCLECKACKTECPMSVDMATMKSEALAQRYALHGTPLGARLFGHARAMNQAGAALAPVSNWVARAAPVRAVLERLAGIDRRRPLPEFARETLSQWFARRNAALEPQGGARRGEVLFLADSFTSCTEPAIGRAAIELLELAGWAVTLVDDVCCGRALISKGLLPQARAQHAALIDRLAPAARRGVPIVGVEPSCVFTLADEVPALARNGEGATAIARQARLVDDLVLAAIDDGGLQLEAGPAEHRVVFHPHCHQKAAHATAGSSALLRRIPGAMVEVLDAGCCGMAGSFGFERAHYDVSLRIGELRLFPAVRAAPTAEIAATGASCRQQVQHGTGRAARHPLVIVREHVRGDAQT
ncbi:MAG: FAD-binding protein [Gemmatimonadetes bacterium]|nr:FAD-binding protein [Gemmatimonadota bacterium]